MFKELVITSYLLHTLYGIRLPLRTQKKALCGNHNRPSVQHSCDILSATKEFGLIVTKLSNL
jgi:hypothetical protein